MSVFNDGPAAFSSARAHEEFQGLSAALATCGAEFRMALDLAASIAVEDLRVLAAKAVRHPPSHDEVVRENLAAMPAAELLQIIVERPRLTLTPDARLQTISPDSATELYTLEPLYGLMFPRDHLLQVEDLCFVATFCREQRQPEAELVALGVGVAMPGLRLVRLPSFFEGGDALACRSRRVLFLAHGYRTSRPAALEIAAAVAERGWTTVLLPDRRKRPEEFHLDHWAAVVGTTLLCDEQRLAGVGEVEWVRPAPGSPSNAGRLDEVLKSLGVSLLPVPRRLAGPVGFNLLDLPGSDAVLCSRSAPEMAAVVGELGRDFVTVEFATIEGNFGSIHCATNELPFEGQ